MYEMYIENEDMISSTNWNWSPLSVMFPKDTINNNDYTHIFEPRQTSPSPERARISSLESIKTPYFFGAVGSPPCRSNVWSAYDPLSLELMRSGILLLDYEWMFSRWNLATHNALIMQEKMVPELRMRENIQRFIKGILRRNNYAMNSIKKRINTAATSS